MAELRVGMWIMHNKKPAIYVKQLDGVTSEVHYVDSTSGETVTIAAVNTVEIVQASYEQIPLGRRPTDLAYARSKGY